MSEPLTTTDLPVAQCHHCGYKMDACTGIEPGTRPSAGDLTVCASCGAFFEFNDALELVPLSDETFLELPDDTRLQLTRARIVITERGAIPRQTTN